MLALLGVGLAAAPLLNARTPQSAPPAATSTGSTVAPADVLNKYCVGCHNDRLKTAGLQIDTLQASPIADHAPQWEKIVTRLRTGEMPPPGRPRPDSATYRRVVTSLERALDAAAAANPHPGRVPVHRLNRSDTPTPFATCSTSRLMRDRSSASDEADQEGFDNVASVLSLSPALLEDYLSAARQLSRRAVGDLTLGP